MVGRQFDRITDVAGIIVNGTVDVYGGGGRRQGDERQGVGLYGEATQNGVYASLRIHDVVYLLLVYILP